jgi:quinol monooxygenase YgiN
MEFTRRKVLALLAAPPVLISAWAEPEGAKDMYGLIVKLTAAAGMRDELIGILKESSAGMPGCLSYVIAKDSADENAIWVTEVWESQEKHDASLALPAVKNAVPRAKTLISAFDKIAVTTPVAGIGLGSASPR